MKFGLRRLAAFGGVAVVAGAVALSTVGATAGAAAASRPTFNRAAAIAFIRASLRDVKVGSPIRGVHEALSGGIKAANVSSQNWSGYADLSSSGSTYVSVKGSWKEPTVTCPVGNTGIALAAFWVGIDGFSSQTVEQDGTVAECLGTTYLGSLDWWEMYPTNAIQPEQSVSPGDSISASVTLSSGKYTLKVTDKTNSSASFSTTQTCGTTACADSSAEWIAEAPANSSGILPLAKFTTWHLTGGTAKSGTTSGVISHFTHDKINMVKAAKKVKASTSALNTTGNGFSIKWVSAT